jgi:hypothetical protein
MVHATLKQHPAGKWLYCTDRKQPVLLCSLYTHWGTEYARVQALDTSTYEIYAKSLRRAKPEELRQALQLMGQARGIQF